MGDAVGFIKYLAPSVLQSRFRAQHRKLLERIGQILIFLLTGKSLVYLFRDDLSLIFYVARPSSFGVMFVNNRRGICGGSALREKAIKPSTSASSIHE
jgi:hypothetical protein